MLFYFFIVFLDVLLGYFCNFDTDIKFKQKNTCIINGLKFCQNESIDYFNNFNSPDSSSDFSGLKVSLEA